MMSYRYLSLAAGRLARFRDTPDLVPLDRDWNEIPVRTDEEDMKLWNKRVIDTVKYEGVLYARLEV